MTTDRWICAVLAAMLLLAGGCGKKRGDSTDHTLRSAAYRGDVAQVQSLIVRGLSVHSVDSDGDTPLHYAAQGGRLEVAEFLLRCGAHVDAADKRGRTPAMVAMAADHRTLVEHLIGAGAALDLHLAAYLGRVAEAEEMLDAGKDVDATGPYEWTALYYAISANQREVVQLLLAAGADLETMTGRRDRVREDTPTTALHHAIDTGHAGLMQLLLDGGARVEGIDGRGVTPLLSAIRQGKLDVVSILIANGADVNVRLATPDFPEDTPLEVAIERGYIEMARRLIAAGADVKAGDEFGWTPLHVLLNSYAVWDVEAAMSIRRPAYNAPLEDWRRYSAARDEMRRTLAVRMVQLLLDHGVDVNARDVYGVTPLHCAALRQSHRVVELLLESGAEISPATVGDPNIESSVWTRSFGGGMPAGVTPLHQAAVGDDPNVIDLLLARGAVLDAQDASGETPLFYAVENGRRDAVDLLIARGANVNTRNKGGATPLAIALHHGRVLTAKSLLAAGAEPVVMRDYVSGLPEVPQQRLLLHKLFRGAYPPRLEQWVPDRSDQKWLGYRRQWIELLLANGADPNERDERGDTPLAAAVQAQESDFARLLLAHGTDVNAKNRAGLAALHYAASAGWRDLASLLLENGADADIRDNGSDTPLHGAALRGRRDVVEVLLAHGADPGVANSRGRTPLDEAVRRGHKDIVRLLTAKIAERAATAERDGGSDN